MKKSKQKFFEQQLSKLNESQKRFLYKRAANMRKAAQIRSRNQRKTRKQFNAHGAAETMAMFEKPLKIESLSINDWALKVIEEEGVRFLIENTPTENSETEYTQAKSGIVISASAAGCCIRTDEGMIDCILGPELSMNQKSDIAVGDKVNYTFSNNGTAVAISVEQRVSKLSRPDPTKAGIERVVAANVDVAVVVAAIRQPLLKPSLIDRYLLAAQKGGIETVVCVNKIDLLLPQDKQKELEILEPYRQIGLDIIECSAQTGFGIERLKQRLSGKICVFVGHSGTGKSSILNAISPKIAAQVGSVHEPTGLGRHTTSQSVMYELEGNIQIIDTPGIREFGLWQFAPEDLKWYFDEFDEFAEKCRYANCSHTHEPCCAVKEAVEKGVISKLRYDSYRRILDTI